MIDIDTRRPVTVPIDGENVTMRVRRLNAAERYVHWAKFHRARALDETRAPDDETIPALDEVLFDLAVDRLEAIDVTIAGVPLPALGEVDKRREWLLSLPVPYLVAVHLIATGTPTRPAQDAPAGN